MLNTRSMTVARRRTDSSAKRTVSRCIVVF
jgi:hypothetical protein